MEIGVLVFIIAYLVFGYWATGWTTHRYAVQVYREEHFLTRLLCAIFIGWLLIPIAIVISD